MSLNRIMSLNRMLCSKSKNGLWKIVTKSQVVTKLDVTKSRLHCTIFDSCQISSGIRRGEDVWEIWQQKYNEILFTTALLQKCRNGSFEKLDELSIYKSKCNNRWDFKKQFLFVKYVINSRLFPQPLKSLI